MQLNDIAKWINATLVNRRDCYGLYTKDGPRTIKQQYSQFTKLDAISIANWIENKDSFGLHVVSLNNTCRFMVFDLDNHLGMTNNLPNAKLLTDVLADLGHKSVIEDSDGKGGFHVWVIWDRPIDSKSVFDFGRLVLDRSGINKIELFPKQPVNTSQNPLGNWIRMPGRNPRTGNSSRFMQSIDGVWFDWQDRFDLIANSVNSNSPKDYLPCELPVCDQSVAVPVSTKQLLCNRYTKAPSPRAKHQLLSGQWQGRFLLGSKLTDTAWRTATQQCRGRLEESEFSACRQVLIDNDIKFKQRVVVGLPCRQKCSDRFWIMDLMTVGRYTTLIHSTPYLESRIRRQMERFGYRIVMITRTESEQYPDFCLKWIAYNMWYTDSDQVNDEFKMSDLFKLQNAEIRSILTGAPNYQEFDRVASIVRTIKESQEKPISRCRR